MIFLVLIILSLFSIHICAMEKEIEKPIHSNAIENIQKAIREIDSTISSISANQTESDNEAQELQEQEMQEFCAIESKSYKKNTKIDKIFEKINNDKLFNELTPVEIFDIIRELVENLIDKFENEIDSNIFVSDQTTEYINKIREKFISKLQTLQLSAAEQCKTLNTLNLLEIKRLQNEIKKIGNNLEEISKFEKIKKKLNKLDMQLVNTATTQQFHKIAALNIGLIVVFCLMIMLDKI